jgi:hypothetical protein
MSMQSQFEEEEGSVIGDRILTSEDAAVAIPESVSEEARALEARLVELTSTQRRANLQMMISSCAVAALVVAPFAVYAYTNLLDFIGKLLITPAATLSVFGTIYSVILLLLFRRIWRMRRKAREVAAQIRDSADLRCVGAMVDVLTIENKALRSVVETTLTSLLPQIKASDAGLLGPTQKRRLSLVLLRPVDAPAYRDVLDTTRLRGAHLAEYQVAILKAFEQVGGASEIKLVRHLAEATATSEAGLKAQEAARQCLVYLNERAAQESAARTLLRGSSALPASPEQLLRPAGGDPGSSANLVRPSEEPEPESEAQSRSYPGDALALTPG